MAEKKNEFVLIDDGVWFIKGFKKYTPTEDELERLEDDEPDCGIDGIIPNGTVLIAQPYGVSDEFFFIATEIRRGSTDDDSIVHQYSDTPHNVIKKPDDFDFDHIVISLGDD